MVPPLIWVAVNVTLVPVQMILSASLETILTLTGKFGLTVIGIPLLVAGLPVAHGVASEVNITVTVWPFVRLEVVKVLLFVPELIPSTCH